MDAITIEDALGPQSQGSGPRPITFDDAVKARAAASSNTVDTDRLGKAQALRDMGLTDPRDLSNPDVPVEGFMRHRVPQVEPAKESNFGQAMRTAIIADPATQSRNAAEHMFPGDPKASERFGSIDGHQVYVDDQSKLRQVSGTIASKVAGMAAAAPEVAGSVVGSFATGNPLTGSAIGAAGGAAVKRGASALLLDEPVTPASVGKEMGTEGAVDLAGGLVGKGVSKFIDRNRVVDFTPDNYRSAESVRDRLKQSTGIDLDLAQASGNQKLIGIRAYAARFPGRSAELIQAAEEAQRGQLDSAVNRTLDSISRASPAEVYGERGMNAAKLVIETAKANRDGAVRPLFDAARSVSLPSDVDAALRSNSVLAHFAAKAQGSPLYQTDLKGLGTDTVGMWHATRMELDDAIAKAEGEPNKVRILTQARRELTEKLESASPEFAKANAEWAKLTRDQIEPLEDSPVGVLSRIRSPKAATAAARIFSDPNVTASELRATRASIEQSDPEAWQGLVRQWVASRWNKALKETQGGSEVNAAGKLRQSLVGTPEDKAKMAVMLPRDSVQAFDDLMEASQSMARTPNAGSNTMRDTEIRDQLKGTALTAYRFLTSPRQAIRDAGEQRALERGTAAIAEAIVNPVKRAQLRQVVQMTPSSQKAFLLSGILTAKVAEKQINQADALPEAFNDRASQ